MRIELGPALAILAQEGFVRGPHLDDPLGDARQQGQVAADIRLHVQAGDLAAEKHAARIAGDAKIHHADFAHGIDHDHLPAAAADMHQGRHQARMIAGRITADDEHQVRMLEILQLHGRGAGAERVGQADAAGLVTVVAAIVDVVRAVQTREELHQEAGFVRAATAGVPEGFVGRDFAQLVGDAP